MKSPSAKMYNLGAHSEAVAAEILNRCQHPQAEPVILSTGEKVACVCIGCYEPLAADYIERQADAAQREACCAHRDEADISAFGTLIKTLVCTDCGRMRDA